MTEIEHIVINFKSRQTLKVKEQKICQTFASECGKNRTHCLGGWKNTIRLSMYEIKHTCTLSACKDTYHVKFFMLLTI